MGLVDLLEKYKFIFEQDEKVIEPRIVKLFRFLNEEKKTKKTRAQLLEVIKGLTDYMNLPKGHELYLLELYLLNYRKDGDYSTITKENFVDPREMRGKTTPNTKADLYTIAQLPFKGSNLEGFWRKDYKGVPYYEVRSYGWYPIYIFKNNRWYEITQSYSSSTGRQMRNANPVEWSDKLDDRVFLVSRKEMEMLQVGATHEDILKNKRKTLKSKEKELQNKRLATLTQNRYIWGEPDENHQGFKVKYKISSVNDEGDKVIVNIDVIDVLKLENGTNRGLETPENYLKGELQGVTKERVEKTLRRKLNGEFREFIGPRYRYNEPLPQTSVIEFNFNHLRK
jgi:hypothetical protein